MTKDKRFKLKQKNAKKANKGTRHDGGKHRNEGNKSIVRNIQPKLSRGNLQKHLPNHRKDRDKNSPKPESRSENRFSGDSSTPDISGKSPSSELQNNFKKKLEGARFRMLNEKLYSCRGEDAFTEFQRDPELFDVVSFF